MYFDYTEQNLKNGHYLSNGPKYVIGLMRSFFLKNNTLRTYWPWPWPRLLLHLSGEMATTKTRRTKAASSMAESESESKRSQLLHTTVLRCRFYYYSRRKSKAYISTTSASKTQSSDNFQVQKYRVRFYCLKSQMSHRKPFWSTMQNWKSHADSFEST